jgi:N-acetylmuramoyl-L-alanine amidase
MVVGCSRNIITTYGIRKELMTYKVKSHLLQGENVVHTNTKKKSGTMKPKFIVIHYTASDNYDGDVRTLSSSNAQASCQLVLSPEGEITQVGKLTDVLWHAGRSKWKGYNGLNRYAIGIEVTSPGPVDKVSSDRYKTWYGAIAKSPYNYVYKAHKNGGPERWWAGFTTKQIEVLKELVPMLMKQYGIEEVVGHDDIAPLRKQDPGPCMPDSLWELFKGRKNDVEVIDAPETTNPVDSYEAQVVVDRGDKLNVRNAPNGDVVGTLYSGLVVTVLKRNGNWLYMKTPGGYFGWVYGTYLSKID